MITRIRQLLLLIFVAVMSTQAWAFKVRSINIEGNDRIKTDTILSYINFAPGNELDINGQQAILMDLYHSDLFKDVKLFRDEDQLIVEVVERPAIASIEFDGNYLLKTKDIENALKQVGLEKGRIYDKSVLSKLELELQRIYYSQGKYGVKMDVDVTEFQNNRVGIDIQIAEGFPAKVVSINIVGNEAFDDETLEDELKLGIPSWWAIFSSRDKYSKPKLQGDLETLTSWYMDRGYIKFSIDSTQVSISPNRKDLYVNVSVSEGERYNVKDTRLAGSLVIDEEELKSLVFIKNNEPFSRKEVQQVVTLIKQRLGKEGYARVKVNVIPEVDEVNKEVVLNFNIDPGRMYSIRNIRFDGNADTFDEVLRREMRQMEGASYDSTKIERGRVRLQRLSYIAQADAEVLDVPGVDDQLDLLYRVDERLSGSINVGAGFSGDGVLFNFGISKDNLFGTGNSLSFKLDRSKVSQSASISYTNPYHTINGVSRGVSLFYRETDATKTNASDYILNMIGGAVNYGIPLSEYSRLRLSLNLESAELLDTGGSPQEVLDFLYPPAGSVTTKNSTRKGEKYINFSPSIGYLYDTRNRTIFAEKGMRQSVSLEVSIPGSDLEYYKANYSADYFWPVIGRSVLMAKYNISYGSGYGEFEELPPYEKYTAGGIRSVRGFRSRSLTSDLGTIDSRNTPYGGDFRTTGSIEYVLPPPGKNNNLRFSLFYDFGNVFSDPKEFEASALRTSAGLALNWLTPVGTLVFSYAEPLQREPVDSVQRFQFTIGGSF